MNDSPDRDRQAGEASIESYAGYRIVDDVTGAFIDLIVGAPAPPEVGQIIFNSFRVTAVEDRTVHVAPTCTTDAPRCALLDRVRDELRQRPDHTRRPKQIVASQGEVDGLAIHFDGRQVVGGCGTPQPRRPLKLFGVPVVKPDGEPWIIDERIGQGVTPVTVIS